MKHMLLSAVLSFGAVYLAVQGGSNFESVDEILFVVYAFVSGKNKANVVPFKRHLGNHYVIGPKKLYLFHTMFFAECFVQIVW